jgi:hypothetical protein
MLDDMEGSNQELIEVQGHCADFIAFYQGNSILQLSKIPLGNDCISFHQPTPFLLPSSFCDTVELVIPQQ